MTINIHSLFSHLDCFREKLVAGSAGEEEKVHQDISVIKIRYQGRLDDFILAENCWSIRKENPAALHSCVPKKRKFVLGNCRPDGCGGFVSLLF